jgi:hypothetical protein
MTLGLTNNNPLTIRTAWYQAAKDDYHYATMPNGQTPLEWAVAGDNGAYNDKMTGTNAALSGSWFYEKVQVWPYQ